MMIDIWLCCNSGMLTYVCKRKKK